MIEEKIYQDDSAEVSTYKCPSCGAQMKYDPPTMKLLCPHCGTMEEVEYTSNVTERDFEELSKTHEWNDDVKVVHCENCGAKEVLQSRDMSTTCPFCGSNTVVDVGEMAGFKPDTLIPFKLSVKEASTKVLTWLKRKFFAPSKFKKEVGINSIHGCYCPVWTFDSKTQTSYTARFGEYYYTTVTINGKTTRQRHVRYYTVRGTIGHNFDDVFVKGNELISNDHYRKIEPFPKKDYVDYNNDFLAGFQASGYTVQPLDAWRKAEETMRKIIRDMIIRKHNPDTVDRIDMHITHNEKSFKYLMLPVYISAVKYKSKLFNQYVNGVHGKVSGRSPVSALKVALTVLGVAAGLGLVALLVSLFGG